MTTAVVINRLPPLAADINVLDTLPNGSALALLPRYAPFTPLAIRLADQGVKFEEISGNRTAILITAIGQPTWKSSSPALRPLCSQVIPTIIGKHRWLIATPVTELSESLKKLHTDGLRIEHVFDY